MHIPVFQKEIIQQLDPKPNENFIDCTLGEAGHTLEILEKNKPNGKVLGIEADADLCKKLKSREKRLILVNDSYANLKEIVQKEGFKKVQGILLDLGISSWHLEESGRGFTFLKNEPLDMRYDLKNPLTAEKIANFWSEQEIEKILKEFGEENFAEKIARGIIEERKSVPIKTTFQLVKIIKKSVPFKQQYQKIHCATRTFQAFRITINQELDNLKKILPQALEILTVGGKLAVISFHSLEDRIVKNFLKDQSRTNKLKILTKKPIIPAEKEIKNNPRSRSAKLRVAEKLSVANILNNH